MEGDSMPQKETNKPTYGFVPSWWFLTFMIVKWSFIVMIPTKSFLQPQILDEISYSTNIVLFLPVNSTLLPIKSFLISAIVVKTGFL